MQLNSIVIKILLWQQISIALNNQISLHSSVAIRRQTFNSVIRVVTIFFKKKVQLQKGNKLCRLGYCRFRLTMNFKITFI